MSGPAGDRVGATPPPVTEAATGADALTGAHETLGVTVEPADPAAYGPGERHASGTSQRREPGRLRAFLPTPPVIGDDGPSPDVMAQASATNITSYLIAGPLTFGLIGHGIDRWLGVGFGTPVGIVLGLALALYIVWFRYGRASTPAQPNADSRATTADRRATGATDEEKR